MGRGPVGVRSSAFAALLAAALGCVLFQSASAMYVANRTLYGDDGSPINMHGLHIFGLNTRDNAAGLTWSTVGAPSEVGDFRTLVWRIQQLGFNAIRLPFNFYFVDQPMNNFVYDCEVTSEADLIAGVTPPGRDTTGFTVTKPPPAIPEGKCNADMPATYLERLIWTICHLTSEGLYVVIDHHLDYSLKSETGAPLNDPAAFAAQYVNLVRELVKRDCARDRLIIDFINEPDAYGFSWTGPHRFPGGVSLDSFYRTLLDTVVPECPTCLYFLEGTDQYNWPVLANWGDGFATLPEIFPYADAFAKALEKESITSAATFFNWLVNTTHMSQVVLSPHVYCPAVTKAETNFAGPTQWRRLTDSFGYLTSEGFVAANGSVHHFPIVIGELGTGFGDAKEKRCFASTAQYIYNLGEAGTQPMVNETWMVDAFNGTGRPIPHYSGKHDTVDNWFWWVWNPDSDDTGGIVDKDRKTIVWYKIDMLAGDSPDTNYTGLRLQPWYKPKLPALPINSRNGELPAPSPAPAPSPTPAATPGAAPPAAPPAADNGGKGEGKRFQKWELEGGVGASGAEPEGTAAAGAAEEAAPAVEEAAPAVEEAAPAVEEAAPVVEEAAPAVEEAAPAVEEAAPVEPQVEEPAA